MAILLLLGHAPAHPSDGQSSSQLSYRLLEFTLIQTTNLHAQVRSANAVLSSRCGYVTVTSTACCGVAVDALDGGGCVRRLRCQTNVAAATPAPPRPHEQATAER